MEARLKKVLVKGAVILSIGCAYSIWFSYTGIGIPCVFHLVTGLKCPGCGVSRMLLSLFRLDFSAAFEYNAVLLCILPVLLPLLMLPLIRYIRTGNGRMTRLEAGISRVLVAVLLIWGVVRNLPGVTFG